VGNFTDESFLIQTQRTRSIKLLKSLKPRTGIQKNNMDSE